MHFGEINLLAVFIATVANQVVGALWYGPFFGKKWMKLTGKTEEELMNYGVPVPVAYLLTFLGAFVTILILSNFIIAAQAGSVWSAALVVLLIWLATIVMTKLNGVLFEQRPFGLFILDSLFDLARYVVAAVIFMLW